MPSYLAPSPIKGTMLRLVAVDVCGNPVTGSGSMVVVTKGFISVKQSPDYEDGEEFFDRNADGEPCVNQLDDPTLKRLALTVEWCQVDPVANAYVLSARLLDAASPAVTGTGWALPEGTPINRFSMEVWQRVAGSGACDASGDQRYIYNAWPNCGAVKLQDYTIENARSTLSFECQTRGAGPLWLDGPGTGTSWLPGAPGSPVALTTDHWLWNITTTAPPAETVATETLT